jgi:hypothetical protein
MQVFCLLKINANQTRRESMPAINARADEFAFWRSKSHRDLVSNYPQSTIKNFAAFISSRLHSGMIVIPLARSH